MTHVRRGARSTSSPVLPDLEEEYPEPTPELAALAELKDEIRHSTAILTILRYAECARDMGFDTDDPAIMRRVIDGANACAEREVGLRHAALTYSALEAVRRRDQHHPSVVYYMLQGGLIKIGLTVNLKSRYRALMPEAVLAVEPGADAVETARHNQFEALRSHGEWFRLESPLREHIEALRARFLAEVGKPIDRWLALLGVPTASVVT